jgi:ATP-binding cassette, subfamily B, multidrug efflux pump
MHLFEFLGDFLKERPLTVASNLAFSFLVPVQDIALPHFYGKLIDSLSTQKDLMKNIVFVLCLFALIEIGFMLSDWHDITTFSTFQTFTRQQVLQNVMQKYENNFTDLYLGSLMSKLVKIPYTLVVWYERLKYHIIPYILVFGFAVCYFSTYDKVLGIALFVTAVGYAGIIMGVPQYFCRGYAVDKDKMVNQIHEEIDDTLRNFIAMHGDKDKQASEVKRLVEYEDLFTVKFAQTMKCLMRTKVYTSLTVLGFTTFFILRSYTLLKKKKLTTAMFSSMFLILIYLSNTMMSLEGQLREMIFDWGIITESDELFDKTPKTLETKNKTFNTDKEPLPSTGIGMRNVAFSFPGRETNILNDISFHIAPGENVVILGDIGSGKSTILKLLLKFNEPNEGYVYLNGKPYSEMTMKEIKNKIGYVPQQPLLFNRTVLENITYGTEGVSREKVEAFVKKIGVDKEFVNLENGLDTKVGKNGSKLSGGQRQIVWCLRTFFQDPDILILDEPTASLDEKSTQTLKNLLQVMMKSKTVIVVTHDPGLLDLATRKLVVRGGEIVEYKDNETKTPDMEYPNMFIMSNGLLAQKGI